MNHQRLDKFTLPKNFRGASAVKVQVWWIVEATLFRLSPQVLYGWRNYILRLFGAVIGTGVLIRPTAKITYPWKVEIGDYSWIGDEVCLYSLGHIYIGSHTVISQRSYICAGDHDPIDPHFSIRSAPIRIGNGCWIATDTFVAPGVTINDNALVGARSSVFSDIPENTISHGSPCKTFRIRFRK